MPILKVDTNLNADQVPKTFNFKATETLASILNKPIHNVTVVVESNKRLTIGGNDDPAALVELRAIGGLKGNEKVVEALTNLIQSELGISANRFYINLVELDPELVAFNGELRSVTMKR